MKKKFDHSSTMVMVTARKEGDGREVAISCSEEERWGRRSHRDGEGRNFALHLAKKISPLNNQNFTFNKNMKINLEKFGATSFSLY